MQKYSDSVIVNGLPLSGATCTVTTYPGGATPTLYSDNGITPLSSNVLTTDSTGRISFYAADGHYSLVYTKTGYTTVTLTDILLEDPADGTAITVTTINKVTITQPATSATLTIADGKTLNAQRSLTLTGTDSTTHTFPSTNSTLARTDAAQTFTGLQTLDQLSVSGTSTTVSASNTGGGDAYVGVTSAAGTTEGSNRVALFRSNASGRDAYVSLNDNVSASVRIGQLSGDLYLWANGATRTRIKTSGDLQHLGLLDISSAAAGQISFPASQNASAGANVLDDYEEGTWTPAFTFGSGSCTYTAQVGTYTKIGRQVTVQARFAVNTISSPSGTLQVSGLPFTNSSGDKGAASIFGSTMAATAATCMMGYVESSATTIRLYHFAAGAVTNAGADIAAGTGLYVTATYEV